MADTSILSIVGEIEARVSQLDDRMCGEYKHYNQTHIYTA